MRMKMLVPIMVSIAILSVAFNAQAGLFNARYLKEQKAKQDDYFKNPHNRLMLVVDQVNSRDTSASIDFIFMTYFETGTSSASAKKLTPLVVVQDFTEALKTLHEAYSLAPADKKDAVLAMVLLKVSPVSVTASSTNCYGLKLQVYFDGKIIAEDMSTLDYPIVSAAFNLPFADILKKGAGK